MSSPPSLSLCQADAAVDLYKLLAEGDGNVFLSPLSISIALAMTYSGTGGATRQETNEVMFKGMAESDVHAAFAELIKTLNTKSNSYQLHTANRLYSMSNYPVADGFKNGLAKHYQSEFRQVDFKSHAEEARQEINNWVADTTNQKIKDLLAPGVLDALTRLVIVNAVYFKGDWDKKFQESATQKKPFYVAPNKEIQVDMMSQKANFRYGENADCQVLGMDYKEHHLTMFVVLPKERYGLKSLEKKLTGAMLVDLVNNTSNTEVIVEMPKFKMEQSFELNDQLKKLGLKKIFNEEADFSRITTAEQLYVSKVIHKAFIEVNERGSEAAAATAVIMNRCMAMPRPMHEPRRFTVDHGCVFAIWDNRPDGGTILFLGKLSSP